MNKAAKTGQKQFTSTHRGTCLVESSAGFISSLRPISDDPSLSPIGESILPANERRCRIRQPAIRRGFLQKGPDSDRTKRGQEPFISVSWDKALGLVASELLRVKSAYTNEAINEPNTVNMKHDAGSAKARRILDRLIKERTPLDNGPY